MGVKFAVIALSRLTPAQRDALVRLDDARNEISVSTAWDLGEGWICFNLTYPSGTTIYGGIDPQGEVST